MGVAVVGPGTCLSVSTLSLTRSCTERAQLMFAAVEDLVVPIQCYMVVANTKSAPWHGSTHRNLRGL